MGKDPDAEEGSVEPKLERSDAKPFQKVDSFASTASSKTTLQPRLDHQITWSNANVAASQSVVYPLILKPQTV